MNRSLERVRRRVGGKMYSMTKEHARRAAGGFFEIEVVPVGRAFFLGPALWMMLGGLVRRGLLSG